MYEGALDTPVIEVSAGEKVTESSGSNKNKITINMLILIILTKMFKVNNKNNRIRCEIFLTSNIFHTLA